jgi:hypothetical protein
MSYESNSDCEDISEIATRKEVEVMSQASSSTSFISRLISSNSFDESSSLQISNSKNDSIVVKQVLQDYDGMLFGIEDLSEIEKCEKQGNSLALTAAKESLTEEIKKTANEFLHNAAFAVPGKFFCKECLKETVSQIRFVAVEPGFWKSLANFFKTNKCCLEKNACPDIVHECPECHFVLARISAL